MIAPVALPARPTFDDPARPLVVVSAVAAVAGGPFTILEQAVYCHNPLPYWHPTLRDLRFDRLEFARSFLYGFVMRAFASRNDHVVGQLPWYTEFIGGYMGVPRDRLLVVAPRAAGTIRSTDPAGRSGLEEGPHDRFASVHAAPPPVF